MYHFGYHNEAFFSGMMVYVVTYQSWNFILGDTF